MAEPKRTDLLGRLAGLSEDAMHRLQDAPGGDRVVGTLSSMRDRVDDLQRRVRGIDELERRISALERKVEKLSKSSGGTTAHSTKPKP